jgi:hypothetical protein
MVKLFKAELTGTGRPVLLRGEVERGMLDKVRGRRVARVAAAATVVLPLALELHAPALPAAGGSGILRQRRREWIRL